MFREITKMLSKNFAKSRKFHPNFYFVFRENFAKLEENFAKHKIKILRNFREITKTKIFVTTLPATGGGHTGLANKTVFKQRRHIQSTKYGVIIKILLNFNKIGWCFAKSRKCCRKISRNHGNFIQIFISCFAKISRN